MSLNLSEIAQQALSLPAEHRAVPAQQLWENLDETTRQATAGTHAEAIAEARKRDKELFTGDAQGRSREDVTAAAKRAIRYK